MSQQDKNKTRRKKKIIYLEQHPTGRPDSEENDLEYLCKKLVNCQWPIVGDWITADEFDELNDDLDVQIEVFANPEAKKLAAKESGETWWKDKQIDKHEEKRKKEETKQPRGDDKW